MKIFKLGFGLVSLANSQTDQINLPPGAAFNPQFAQAEEEKATSESWELDPVVQVRWDFDSCGIQGMYGPTQEQCDEHYFETNLHNNVRVNFGVQSWVVPADGLYLVTAAGPAGSSVGAGGRGKGAVLEANFHLMQGEIIDIIVGQRSDYNLEQDQGHSC